MKTVSINVSTLCVPCANRCRYCLLSWDGKILGADYDRSQRYALRFYNWLRENRPDLSFQFYFGYSMEYSRLLEAIDFSRKIGSVGGRFLQMDGLRFRPFPALCDFLKGLREHGIEEINLTLYGTQEYHDRFAGRAGDFNYLLSMIRAANRIGLNISVGIAVNSENAAQLNSLFKILHSYCIQKIFCFIPHSEGRGAAMESVRFTSMDHACLEDNLRKYINTQKFKSERQWLEEDSFSVPEQRMLNLSLTPENISFFENLSFGDTVQYLENLDDEYYRIIPSLPELARQYGDATNERFYSERDLYLTYQRRYIAENHLKIYDMNDERQCFSRRY